MSIVGAAMDTSPSSLKVGLIGAGVFGGYHAWKIHDHPNAVLTAIFDHDRQCAEALSAKFTSQTANTLDQLLRSVDAIVITTPAHSHAAIALQAFDARCHVFVEKPIALSPDEADKMIGVAASKGLMLQVGHQERYVVQALGLLSLPQSPREIICRRCMPPTGRGEDVSVVMDLMIHDLDLACQFLGRNGLPTIVVDRGANPNHELTATLGDAARTITITLNASRRSKTRERAISLLFDQGEIHLNFLGRTIRNTTSFDLPKRFGEDDDTDQQPLAIRDPLAFGFDQFVSAIAGKKPVAISGEDACRALDLAVQIETHAGLR